jgi:hypothetical protein
MDSCFPFLVEEKNELCRVYREHAECVRWDVALAQASVLATYVSEHAKGSMAKAADMFLSTEGAQFVEKRIAVAKMVYEGEISDQLVKTVANAVFEYSLREITDDMMRCALNTAFKEMIK